MSLASKIDKLIDKLGIEAILVESGIRMVRGDPQWRPTLGDALDLFKRCGSLRGESIRLVIGKRTVVVQREGDETAVVVIPTGHPIAKSLRRMLRRAARPARAYDEQTIRALRKVKRSQTATNEVAKKLCDLGLIHSTGMTFPSYSPGSTMVWWALTPAGEKALKGQAPVDTNASFTRVHDDQ